MSEKLQISKTSGAHARLGKMEGVWKGTTKVWFEANEIADESLVEGTMKLVLNGSMILHEYKGSLAGKPLEGIALYAYDLNLERFQCAWADSFHNGTAIMYSDGMRGDNKFNMLGTYVYITPEAEHTWGWRTEIIMDDDNTIRITAFNVQPDGEEAKATETVYTRVK